MKRIYSIKFVIPVLIIALLAVSLAFAYYVSLYDSYQHTSVTVKRKILDKLNYLQGAAEQFIELGMVNNLNQLIASISSESDLLSILIVDKDGSVLASNRFSEVGDDWFNLGIELDGGKIAQLQYKKTTLLEQGEDNNYMGGYISICDKSAIHGLRSDKCGFILYRVNLQHHYKMTEQALKHQALHFIAGITIAVVLLLLFLHALITRRADRIVNVLSKFNAGQRDVRIKITGKDEITWISDATNKVLDEVVHDENALKDREERLRILFETTLDAIITIDSKGIIEAVNPATELLLGYAENEMIGRNISMIMPESYRVKHDADIDKYILTGIKNIIGAGRELEALIKSGEYKPIELTVTEMNINGHVKFAGILRDISENVKLREAMRKVNEELFTSNLKLKNSVRTDSLTGLTNRGYFDMMLEGEIHRATRQGDSMSLIMLDLDYFKLFNDNYGHQQGDECLKAVSLLMIDMFKRSGEIPARYGGEEFAVILPHTDSNEAKRVTENLRQAINALKISHEKSKVADSVTASLGVATFKPVSAEPIKPNRLINAADGALYEAKGMGRNCAWYVTVS